MSEHALDTVLLVGADAKREAAVRSRLAKLTVRAEAFAGALAAAHRLGPRVAIVDLAGGLEPAIKTVEQLARGASQLHIVALADRKDSEVILRAMRAGAREFVLLEEGEELQRIIGELIQRADSGSNSGMIISAFPVKGGAGATFVATNLAAMLTESSKRVVLVDLDLQLGDVLVSLDRGAEYAISDVLKNMHRLDRELLESTLPRHSSGVQVLSQSDRLEDSDRITPEQITSLLTFLARHYDYVVLDGLRGFDERSIAALDASHRVLMVMAQNVPALKNAQRCLEVFRRLGYGDDKIKAIVNRYLKADPIDLESMVDSLGVSITGVLSNDYATAMAAINKGALLRDTAPRSRLTQDLQRLAVAVGGAGMQKKGSGFFRNLFGQKKTDEVANQNDQKEPSHGLERSVKAV
jgi:pilus assembly protein CpaE